MSLFGRNKGTRRGWDWLDDSPPRVLNAEPSPGMYDDPDAWLAANATPQCPKCGGDMDRLHYAKDEERWPECFRYGCPAREHLHRECSTCGYGRWERCADDPESGRVNDS